MKKQSGFTLIELLLVLAIIGIISAIAIPAILSQRDNAKDRAAESNCANIMGAFVSACDIASSEGDFDGTKDTFEAVIIGTSAEDSKMPELWRTPNPWGGVDGYNRSVVDENTSTGEVTKAAAEGKLGQVQIGFNPGDSGETGVAAAVLFKKKKAGEFVFVRYQGI